MRQELIWPRLILKPRKKYFLTKRYLCVILRITSMKKFYMENKMFNIKEINQGPVGKILEGLPITLEILEFVSEFMTIDDHDTTVSHYRDAIYRLFDLELSMLETLAVMYICEQDYGTEMLLKHNDNFGPLIDKLNASIKANKEFLIND